MLIVHRKQLIAELCNAASTCESNTLISYCRSPNCWKFACALLLRPVVV
jgi:hypothetical protein